MKFVIFGLGISSSWGNGHATLMRGLLRALIARGHSVVFFERDVPYYAAYRDLHELAGGELVLYPDLDSVRRHARHELSGADVGMVTSYCPDAIEASELVLASPAALRTFYDLDAPVTLENWRLGNDVQYIGPHGLGDFDLVLSYTGGTTLDELQRVLGARRVTTLYGSVDPDVHYPVAAVENYRGDLSYLATYSFDRQPKVNRLFAAPAQCMPERRFILGGPNYDGSIQWTPNMVYFQHVAPDEHPAFYCSSRITLNVTRGAMAGMGYCPSARLFEAAACGVSVLSDWWEGLDMFFEPDIQIMVARTTDDVIRALRRDDGELKQIARAARERTLDEHTSQQRARELEAILERALHSTEMQLAKA